MKGLIKTSVILAVLIVIGIGISVIVTNALTNQLTTAHESGYGTGYAWGYEMGLQQGNQVGYQEGSKVGYVKSNAEDGDSSQGGGFYFVYKPTFDELRKILAEGKTGSVMEVHDYTEANGIRTAYVRIPIARPAAEGMVYIYELVAFETVDQGLLIIEPWSHREVRVEVGERYSELNDFSTSLHDDTITDVTIVW